MVTIIFKISTIVPENFHELLETYTKQGFRVIALAHRLVESQSLHRLQKIQREDLENGLTFLGTTNLSILNKLTIETYSYKLHRSRCFGEQIETRYHWRNK